MDFKKVLKQSIAARIALVLVALDFLAAVYIALQAARYEGMIVLLASLPVILLVTALLVWCTLKNAKLSLALEILLAIVLIGKRKVGRVGGALMLIGFAAYYACLFAL